MYSVYSTHYNTLHDKMSSHSKSEHSYLYRPLPPRSTSRGSGPCTVQSVFPRRAPVVHKLRVGKLDLERFKPRRAGIILTFVHEGPDGAVLEGGAALGPPSSSIGPKRYFILGEDRKSHDYGDFGGQATKDDRDCIAVAFRELDEELLGLQNELFTEDDIRTERVRSLVVKDRMNMVLFVEVKLTLDQAVQLKSRFLERVEDHASSEMSNIHVIDSDYFRSLIYTRGETAMYTKVSCLLQEAGEFFHLL